MNIQEALKSNKPFKRPHYDNWLVRSKNPLAEEKDDLKQWKSIDLSDNVEYIWEGTTINAVFTRIALLANDWIIKEVESLTCPNCGGDQEFCRTKGCQDE